MLDYAWQVYGIWIWIWILILIGIGIGIGIGSEIGTDCQIRHDGDGLGTESVRVCSCDPGKRE